MDFNMDQVFGNPLGDPYLSHLDPFNPILLLQIITVTDCYQSERIKKELQPALIYWCNRLNVRLGWLELPNYYILPGMGYDFLGGDQIKSYPFAFVMPEAIYLRQKQFTQDQIQSSLLIYEGRFDNGKIIQLPQACNLTLAGLLKLVVYYPYSAEYARAFDLSPSAVI